MLKNNLIAPAPAVQQGIRSERRRVGNGATQMDWAQIYVIPFSVVDAICVTIRPRLLSKKFLAAHCRRGDCERGYERGGFTIRAKTLIEAFPHGRIQ